jgi:hypothetical protein
MIGEPEIGSPEMPTIGSIGHARASCKPCAFVYTKGCVSGARCRFCHLCGPDARKVHIQEKKRKRNHRRRE